MKKFCALVLCFGFVTVFSGCQRRPMPNEQQKQQQIRQGQQPETQRGELPQISSTKGKEKYYNGIATRNMKVQTGMDGDSDLTYDVSNGDMLRVIGKSGGYNVCVLPNKQIGMVPENAVQPGSPQAPANTGGTAPAPQPGDTTKGATGGNGSAAGGAAPVEASSMVTLVNQARAQASLKPLTANKELTNVANLKAADMVSKNYFNHNSPTYGSPFDMMKKYNVAYLYAGENLALNQNVNAAQQALMNSPGHKANILGKDFTQIGIGIAKKSDGSKVYVQMFIGN